MIPEIVVLFLGRFSWFLLYLPLFLAICIKRDITCHSYHIHHSCQGVFIDDLLLYRTDLFIEHKIVI